ncbi:MAG: T9SS type A sorting domain-containing protein [Bacteroidetes bacterium]|nr:T9SS type A sorting domain-containing protein [Bacteroidota bacterium]
MEHSWNRNTLALLLIGLAAQKAGAQPIIRFSDPGAAWHVAWTRPAGDINHPNFIGTTTTTYRFNGDTLADGISWQRMYSEPAWGGNPGALFRGYTRQEGPVVLFRDAGGTVDTLYNFALQVGDSMRFGRPGSGFEDKLAVLAIGQVLVNGVAHKVFHFSMSTVHYTLESFLSDTWIEGIGSIHGPLAPWNGAGLGDSYPSGIPDSTRLACYSQDEVVLWQHEGYPACITNIQLSVGQQADAVLRAYPNPAHGLVTVEVPAGGNFAVSLHDLLGRVVLRMARIDTLQLLDLRSLPPGPYVLEVHSESGARQRTRVQLQ